LKEREQDTLLTKIEISKAVKVLEDQNIASENLVDYAIPAINRVAGTSKDAAARTLQRLVDFTTWLHNEDVESWTPLSYAIPSWATLLSPDEDAFILAVDSTQELIKHLKTADINIIHCLQKGPTAMAEQCRDSPWVVQDALDLAIRLAAKHLDPTETLRFGISALHIACGTDSASFPGLCTALEEAVDRLDEYGISPSWPIYQGILVLANSFPGQVNRFLSALEQITELAILLQQADMSPYPTIEYDLVKAFQSLDHRAGISDRILPIALTLTRNGYPPNLFFTGIWRNLAYMDEGDILDLVDLVEKLVDKGLDAGSMLISDKHIFTSPGMYDPRTRQEIRNAIGDLLGEMHDHDINPNDTLQSGLLGFVHNNRQGSGAPVIPDHDDLLKLLYAILDYSTRLVRQRIDPHQVLSYGLGRLWATRGTDTKRVIESIAMTIDLQPASTTHINFLGYTVPSIIQMAGEDDALFEQAMKQCISTLNTFQLMDFDYTELLITGIPPFIQGLRKVDVTQKEQLFEVFINNLIDLVNVFKDNSISVTGALKDGIPQIISNSNGENWQFEQVFTFSKNIARTGVDPALFLACGIPELVRAASGESDLLRTLLSDIEQTIVSMKESGLNDYESLASACKSLVELGEIFRWAIPLSLSFIRTLLGSTISACDTIRFCFAEIAAGNSREECSTILGDLSTFQSTCHAEGYMYDTVIKYCLPVLYRIADGDISIQRQLLSAVHGLLRKQRTSSQSLQGVFVFGTLIAVELAGDNHTIVIDILDSLAEKCTKYGPGDTCETVLRLAHETLVSAVDNFESFTTLLELQTRLSPLFQDYGLRFLATAAASDFSRFSTWLLDLITIEKECLLGDEPLETLSNLLYFAQTTQQEPSFWSGLIIPTIRAQKQHAGKALLSYRSMYELENQDTISLLRYIITQHGVEAIGIITDFLRPGLGSSSIVSLAGESEMIIDFLKTIPYHNHEYYAEYKAIAENEQFSPAEKKRNLRLFLEETENLNRAIVTGEVTEEQERHPLFTSALYFLFPPACYANRSDYMNLYHRFDDHPEHVAKWSPDDPQPAYEYQFKRGGYEIVEGAQINLKPWKLLNRVVQSVSDAKPAQMLHLGQSIFQNWLDSKLGKQDTRIDLLSRIYAHYLDTGSALPVDLDTASALLAYHSFFTETVTETVQEALHQYANSDRKRYVKQLRAKMTPPAYLGKGLIRGVKRTVQSFQVKDIDRQTAEDRLVRQLGGFDLSGSSIIDTLLETSMNELADILGSLKKREIEYNEDDAQQRILKDLAGADQAAMQRELFGTEKRDAKVVFQSNSGDSTLTISIALSKRKAHAPIGHCEGVCTAPDSKLWDNPNFIQAIIWGPDGRAMGGIHLLIVEEQGKQYLTLPGINPSLRLLQEVDVNQLLDAVLDLASMLAGKWHLAGVWLPAQRGILSNRLDIQDTIQERDFELRDIGVQEFSYSPYRYNFDKVLVVPFEK
jgi:post-segregation antitoxin (ccd killing protein)